MHFLCISVAYINRKIMLKIGAEKKLESFEATKSCKCHKLIYELRLPALHQLIRRIHIRRRFVNNFSDSSIK